MGRRGGENMPGEPAPSNLLYAVVALGMRAYVRITFRLRILGAENAPVRPGMMIVATHRTDNDVPVVGSLLYLEGRGWRGPARMHFASRDDLFERGALAGMAPGLPRFLSRLLWRVTPAGGLARVRVHPVGRADLAAPAQALRALPADTPLREAAPEGFARRLEQRAAERGVPAPATASQALAPQFADILFDGAGPEKFDAPLLDEFWQRRSRDAAKHVRHLADLVRSGEPLVIFPEGGLSVDGAIGPLRRGFGVLARAARPSTFLPLALAYDSLATGRRPRLIVAVGSPFAPEKGREEAAVLQTLRRLMPLTVSQVVARAMVDACDRGASSLVWTDLARELELEIDRSLREGRPVDPALRAPRSRQGRLEDAIAALCARGAATAGAERIGIDPATARSDELVMRLAREYASARAADVGSP
jgi:1-acyl-sn-glycerol-3-phosphate acyltransferase